MALFKDRRDAGRRLARELSEYAGDENVIVLGLARGGVPVAYEVAQFLYVPLDVFLVRKLGLPGQEELAMGAIASGGAQVLNQDVVAALLTAAITFSYGLLEANGLVPHLPLVWIAPLMIALWGTAAAVVSRHYQ